MFGNSPYHYTVLALFVVNQSCYSLSLAMFGMLHIELDLGIDLRFVR